MRWKPGENIKERKISPEKFSRRRQVSVKHCHRLTCPVGCSQSWPVGQETEHSIIAPYQRSLQPGRPGAAKGTAVKIDSKQNKELNYSLHTRAGSFDRFSDKRSQGIVGSCMSSSILRFSSAAFSIEANMQNLYISSSFFG